jgi:hypothetical protein
MDARANKLEVDDVFRLHVSGRVVSITSVGEHHVKIKLLLEDQGRRSQHGWIKPEHLLNRPQRRAALEFTDAGCVVEFLCRTGRKFRLLEWTDYDDDDEDDIVPVEPLSPEPVEPA